MSKNMSEFGIKYVMYKISMISKSLEEDKSKENLFWQWYAIILLLTDKTWIKIIAHLPEEWRKQLDTACKIVLPYDKEFKERKHNIEERLKGYGIKLD